MIKIKKRYVNPSEEYRDYFSNQEYFINKFNDFTYNDRFKQNYVLFKRYSHASPVPLVD